MACKTGNHDHQGHISLYGQTHLLLQGSLAPGLAVPEGVCIIVGRQSRVGLRVKGAGVNTIGDAGQLPGCAGNNTV